MKKFFALLVIFALLLNVSAFASTNKPLVSIGSGWDVIVYGDLEVPDSIDETNTKGSPAYPDCTAKTDDDVGRGIARFVGGIWKLAIFWYPED